MAAVQTAAKDGTLASPQPAPELPKWICNHSFYRSSIRWNPLGALVRLAANCCNTGVRQPLATRASTGQARLGLGVSPHCCEHDRKLPPAFPDGDLPVRARIRIESGIRIAVRFASCMKMYKPSLMRRSSHSDTIEYRLAAGQGIDPRRLRNLHVSFRSARRNWFPSSAAHNAIRIDGRNQAEFAADF